MRLLVAIKKYRDGSFFKFELTSNNLLIIYVNQTSNFKLLTSINLSLTKLQPQTRNSLELRCVHIPTEGKIKIVLKVILKF